MVSHCLKFFLYHLNKFLLQNISFLLVIVDLIFFFQLTIRIPYFYHYCFYLVTFKDMRRTEGRQFYIHDELFIHIVFQKFHHIQYRPSTPWVAFEYENDKHIMVTLRFIQKRRKYKDVFTYELSHKPQPSLAVEIHQTDRLAWRVSASNYQPLNRSGWNTRLF